MFERLVAAVIVIGAVLWGASILASPGDGADAEAPRESREDPGPTPILDDEDVDEDKDEDDEKEERGEREGKRKKGRHGGD